ncbi:unnamed protein product [Paramecium pentaurelia]|uniref:Transmembrane protein n=1 Tax=Paramecium pentaurelia TaxID=43138 RepID=A0A8S1X107_9CILI|nr:unnamed protein product [Paramecium pentaurelia]
MLWQQILKNKNFFQQIYQQQNQLKRNILLSNFKSLIIIMIHKINLIILFIKLIVLHKDKVIMKIMLIKNTEENG